MELNKTLITFPFVSDNQEEFIYDMDENENKYAQYAFNQLIIPDLFTKYLYEIFNYWSDPYDKYSDIFREVLRVLLFYKKYSNISHSNFV